MRSMVFRDAEAKRFCDSLPVNLQSSCLAAATAQYQDVRRARADGYQPVTGVLTGSAMHFVSQSALEEEGFVVTRPEVLLYDDGAAGRLDLVGVAYLLPRQSQDDRLPTQFSPLGHWHAHDYRWPCLTVRTEGPLTTIDRQAEECRAGGDLIFPTRFWMLHVWLYRPGRDGIFSERNSTVRTSEILGAGSLTQASGPGTD